MFQVSDEVYETEFEFMFSKPSITAKGRRAEITTATYLSISNPTHAGASNISADQIALKMKNKDAILKEIGVTNAKNNPISCREINDVSIFKKALVGVTNACTNLIWCHDVMAYWNSNESHQCEN